jgi:capsular polysaccharide export protein
MTSSYLKIFGIEIGSKRKLRKLIRDPKRYILDMRMLRSLRRAPTTNGTPSKPVSKSTAPKPKQSPPHTTTSRTITVPGLEPFELFGSNWLDGEAAKPLAILWGFNPWKRDFVARYLPEYRIAYARGRTPWSVQKRALDQLTGLTFVVWGMCEHDSVREYAEQHGIPLYRMEDGFIRSTDLGSKHTVPLSLVLDKSGIYFDASRPSDLESLLNTYDFEQNPGLLDSATSLLKLVRSLRVSKYNLASLRSPATVLGPKLKHRVLVIGQVEGDASIRYGLADGWTNDKLIELARGENPGAEIIYRPHPDVAHGFRTDSSILEKLEKLCRIITGDFVLGDLFKEVDHVYTITSLGGFEALMHGVKVTVVGAPFYAGWGLTDDRTAVPGRVRKLSLEQLFCAAYLLYPRYLPSVTDPVKGCLAAILRVSAERKQQSSRLRSPRYVEYEIHTIAASDNWPALLRPEYLSPASKKHGKKFLSILQFNSIFSSCPGQYYQSSLACILVGKLQELASLERILNILRINMAREAFKALILDIWEVAPSDALLSQWAWLNEQQGNISEARNTYRHMAIGTNYKTERKGNIPFPAAKKYSQILSLAQFELRHRNLEESYRLFKHLLLSGHTEGEVIAGIAEIARLRFDFPSAAALMKFYNHYNPSWKAGNGHVLEAKAHGLARNATAAVEAMALACKINPQFAEAVSAIDDVAAGAIGDLPYFEAMVAAYEIDDGGSPIARAKALIASERPADAERLLLEHSPMSADIPKFCLTLSLAYSYQGKLAEAKALIKNVLPRHPTAQLYRECLRLAVVENNYVWGKSILEEAASRDIDVGEMYFRKISFGLGNIKEAYLSFREMPRLETLRAYLGDRYVQRLSDLPKEKDSKVSILSFFGPGDEIRFASLYREMKFRCGEVDVSFTCDPRLLNLLQRHYNDLHFVPTSRVRSLTWLSDYKQHDRLPGSDLHTFFDNVGWDLVKSSDSVILTTDAIGDVIDGYQSFKGTPFLKADPVRIAEWKLRLAPYSTKPLVGLSWRSSLATYSRNEHYLSVQELAPIFDLRNIQFVNLQYDECDGELAWLEEHFPGQVLNFQDLDQFNDLDGVAALMECLNLIVAPATTVFELAGALGRPTLLLSNSSEMHWRKIPGTDMDAWHHSITHVEGERLGDKMSLSRALVAELKRRVHQNGQPPMDDSTSSPLHVQPLAADA